jgi:His/Glu/Gln/Arg/opine family amino acid ABC transporter permease subunit
VTSAQILSLLLRGLVVTIEATLAGFVCALVGGLVLALGYRARSQAARYVSRGLVEFIRNTPLLVQLYFLFYGLPLLGIRFSAMMPCLMGSGRLLKFWGSAAGRRGCASFCPKPFPLWYRCSVTI